MDSKCNCLQKISGIYHCGLYDSGFGLNKGLQTLWTVPTSVYAIDIYWHCAVILYTHVNLLNKRFWIPNRIYLHITSFLVRLGFKLWVELFIHFQDGLPVLTTHVVSFHVYLLHTCSVTWTGHNKRLINLGVKKSDTGYRSNTKCELMFVGVNNAFIQIVLFSNSVIIVN